MRENIINYDDEGGGEDDMTAFDITPLQIPIGGPVPEMPAKLPCKYNLSYDLCRGILVLLNFKTQSLSTNIKSMSNVSESITCLF